MFVGWGIPYGIAAFYDFLLGQEFLPKEYPTIGNIIPNWASWAWLVVGAIALIAVTLEGTYRYSKRIQTKYERETSRLQLEVNRLQDDLTKPIIELVFNENYPNCIEIVADDERGLYYIYRIGVRVTGNKTIENVAVDLLEFESWNNMQDKHTHTFHPCTLRPMNHRVDSPCYFTVHSGYAITNYVDAFIWKPDKNELEICCCNNPILITLEPNRYYDLTLLAKGKDAPQTDYSLHLSIGRKSKMTLEEIEQWELGEQ